MKSHSMLSRLVASRSLRSSMFPYPRAFWTLQFCLEWMPLPNVSPLNLRSTLLFFHGFLLLTECNCVGCDGRGLADAVAKTLPYGCSYKSRRRMPPANKFAIPSDRAVPGTIEVRNPPKTLPGVDKRPAVLNLFAQWEMGAPGKYNRVQPAPESDSARQREAWFAQCLQAISVLEPKPATIAFPHQIGCGLAGGNWGRSIWKPVPFTCMHCSFHNMDAHSCAGMLRC